MSALSTRFWPKMPVCLDAGAVVGASVGRNAPVTPLASEHSLHQVKLSNLQPYFLKELHPLPAFCQDIFALLQMLAMKFSALQAGP